METELHRLDSFVHRTQSSFVFLTGQQINNQICLAQLISDLTLCKSARSFKWPPSVCCFLLHTYTIFIFHDVHKYKCIYEIVKVNTTYALVTKLHVPIRQKTYSRIFMLINTHLVIFFSLFCFLCLKEFDLVLDH